VKRPLTVIVSSNNGLDNIADSVKSVAKIADEILIVGICTSGEMPEIEPDFEDFRLIHSEFPKEVDSMERAISSSRNDWILQIESDERVTEELSEEIEMLLNRGPTADGYWIDRDNHFMGINLRWGEARNDEVLRLFHREHVRCEASSAQVSFSVESEKVENLKSRFSRFSVNSYDELFLDLHRESTDEAERLHERGKDVSYFKLLMSPLYRFFREYVLLGGILDGKAGLQLAWMAAFRTFSKQARLWELNHEFPDRASEGLVEFGQEADGFVADDELDASQRRAA